MPATLTPDRQVTVQLDVAETVQVEPFFSKTRMRFEIRNPVVSDVEQLASGIWTLKPQTTSLSFLSETTAGQTRIVRLSQFVHPPEVQEIPLQRAFTELTGVAPAAAVSASGDHFYIKRLQAPATWNIGLIETRTIPPLPTPPNYPLDVVMQHSVGLDPSDQGYVLRWIHPSHGQAYIDYVLSFQFGGEITPGGYGLFELVFGGDGRAFLYEWIDGGFVAVDEWRYAAAELVPGAPHTVRLIPHAGRFLEVRTNITERAQPGFLFTNKRLTAFSGQSVSLDAHLYETTNRNNLPPPSGGYGYPVTGEGHPAFRVRRDILLRWQLSRITYPASGTLLDQPFTLPQVDTSVHVLDLRPFVMVYYNTLSGAPHGAVSATAQNALNAVPLVGASENWSVGGKTYLLNGFTLPGAPNAIQVLLNFQNLDGAGGTYSPWLFGYEAHKVGHSGTSGTSPLIIDGSHYRQSPCTRVSLTGPDNDPSHETGFLHIEDLVNRCSRLNVRGEGRVRVLTTFDPADQSKQSVLFDGFWIKSEGHLRGKAAQTYPSPSWTSYDLSCLGMWKRLHQRDFLAIEILNLGVDLDPTVPPSLGQSQPSKVTDAIRFLLVCAGIPESQTLIPDLPIRLWRNNTQSGDTITVQPGTNCAEFVRHLAEDYLNYYLAWDSCASTNGQWRLKPVPSGSEPSVWTFTDALPSAGHLATHAGSYPANTTWIARDSLNERPVAPEGNWIRVTGEVDGKVYACEANNPKAYNKPGASTADPLHPDYTDGAWHPIFRRHDPTLLTREAVHFVVRRVFDLACRAQRYARFICPLPLIDAASFEPSVYTTHLRRPLAFGDVVTYRGKKAMVTSCNVTISKEFHQLAQIELRLFNDPLPP